jgi:CO dehydrogenase/acetyl-CoA synthase epsilon subunit
MDSPPGARINCTPRYTTYRAARITPMIKSTKRNLMILGATKLVNEKSKSEPKNPLDGGLGGA